MDTTTAPGRVIVRVAGEVDMLTAPRLRQVLLPRLDGQGTDMVIDFDQVTFLASTGLGLLVEAAQRARSVGAALHLVSSSHAVLRPLSLTGLDQLFDVLPSLDAVPPPRQDRPSAG